MSKTTSPAGHGAMSKQQNSTANFPSSVALDGRFCWGRQITTRCDLHARNTAATILHENFYHTDIDCGFVRGVTSDAISRTCFGATIIQLHGIGPWQINYVNPADDPRNAKKSP